MNFFNVILLTMSPFVFLGFAMFTLETLALNVSKRKIKVDGPRIDGDTIIVDEEFDDGQVFAHIEYNLKTKEVEQSWVEDWNGNEVSHPDHYVETVVLNIMDGKYGF